MTGLEKLVSMATHRSGKGRKQEQYDGARYVLYFRVSTAGRRRPDWVWRRKNLRRQSLLSNITARSWQSIKKLRVAGSASSQ